MKKIKRYIPDILINLGIWVFFYVKYFPVKKTFFSNINLDTDYSNHFKFIGIVLVTLGINIAIRTYLKKRKEIK